MPDKSEKSPVKPRKSRDRSYGLGSRILFGCTCGFLLVAGVGGWAATAQLNGAIIAKGEVAVDQNLKVIQHREGGIVNAIHIREGDVVEAGQILFQLDDAQTRAEISILQAQLIELEGRHARLAAERDGKTEIEFPRDFLRNDPDVEKTRAGEVRLFNGNLESRASRKNQLQLSIDQIQEEITGLETQLEAKKYEIDLVQAEKDRIADLANAKLVEASRVYSIDREHYRLKGEAGQIKSAIARSKVKISEIQIQIVAIDDDARTEAQREITLVSTRISELRDREIASRDRLQRTDIRAPISGIINELKIHTVGGVIGPAEVLASLVPENATLKISVEFSPLTIDQINLGQTARLRFTSFNQRTTPELQGKLIYLAAAATSEKGASESHYAGDVHVEAAEMAKLDGLKLIPGMPLEVFMVTENRSALSYLMKPVTDQFNRAFRER